MLLPLAFAEVPVCDGIDNCRSLIEVYYNGTVDGAGRALEGSDGKGGLTKTGNADGLYFSW